jgi:hypothetical protein
MLLPDGVFVRDGATPDARPRFVPLSPPADADIAALLDRVIARVTALVAPRLEDDGDPDDSRRQLAAFAARPVARSGDGRGQDEPGPLCARKNGWSLHAATWVHENDRLGLERLARYCLRPPISPARLQVTDDGHILYHMKRRWSDGTDTLRLTPRELVVRLCALLPPPRTHLVRYYGIFSAHSRGRFALTGRGLHDPPAAPAAAAPPVPRRPPPSSDDRGPDAPDRGPDAPDRARRLSWADLLQRVFRNDVLVCPRCDGDMNIIAFITDEAVTVKILRHLGLDQASPPRGPPRSKAQLPLVFPPTGAPVHRVDPPPIDH